MAKKTLGIIGGMGPLATTIFFRKIVDLTPACADQEHIPCIIFNDVLIPDRTGYILDNTKPTPLPKLIENVKKLEYCGADCIAIPCNTSHYFYKDLCSNSKIPIISILDSTLSAVAKSYPNGKAALLATSGTVMSRVYETAAEKYGIDIFIPEQKICDTVMDLIYGQVKKGIKHNDDTYAYVIEKMLDSGCDSIILGCTELSVINSSTRVISDRIFDSTTLLAEQCVKFCCADNK